MPSRGKPRKTHPVQPLAQMMELRDRYERSQIKHDLQAGMLCVEKVGLGYFSDRPVLMLWRILDVESWLDREIIKDHVREVAINQVDCIVARLSDDASYLQFVPHAMERLEPYTELPSAKPSITKRPRKEHGPG